MQLASAFSAQMGVTASMASIVLNTRCTCSIRRNFYVNEIIKGVNGEFYPCKPDIFAKTYEGVTE